MIWNIFERLNDLRSRREQRAFLPKIEALEARDLPSAAPLLQVSANGRYLVAAGTNQPFYLVGDSPWEISTNITEAEASTYFQQRASQGFNTVIIQAVNDVYPGTSEAHPPADTSGDLPFAKLPDGNFDLSKPTTVYWRRIDNLINMAGQDGLEVILFPAFYGTQIFSGDYDWGTQFNDPANTANNNANIRAWGQFLGQRYVNDNNIIWAVGGDYNSLENGASDGQLAALLQGIQQFDTRHLVTMEGWDGFNSSAPRTAFGNTDLRQYMTLDGVYVSHTRPFSSLFQQEYNRSDFGPTFLIESTYEAGTSNDNATTPDDVPHEAYVDFLSGTTGYMYGNADVWAFTTGWQQSMTSVGAQQMTYFSGLVNSLPWYNLVPDWNGTVFQGASTSTDYVGEYAADGSLAVAYKPSTGTGSPSFTVNMSKFSGPVTAEWFDPTNGMYTTIGTNLANSGTQTFHSPTTNSAGQNDFVLILKASPATVPAAPTNLTATSGNAQVTLTWAASSGTTSYNIYRSTTSGGEGSTPIATGVNGTSFTNTGLTNGTTYFYKVAAVNTAGTSPLSNEASATPQVAVPPAPTNLTATAGNAQASLTWTASTGATSYNIYRSTTSGGEGSTPIATGVSTTSYTDTGLTNGTTYYYQVAAVDAAGPSAKSAEASAAPSAQVFMGEQSVLPSVDSNNGNWLIAQQATLSQAATVQSLSVYISQAGGQLLLGVYDASGPGGGPGQLLAAANAITPVVGWNTANVVTPVTLAAGTYWLAFLPSSNSLDMPIASTGSAAWYQFTYGPLPTTFSTTPTDATAHWSVYATLTLNTISPPAAPTNLTATAGNAQVSLSWIASSGATSYNIYRSTTSGAETLLASGITSTSYSNTGLTNGTTYFYKVAAVNAGGTSPLSSEVSATPQVPAPAAPTNLTATAGNAQVSLIWTASSGAASYTIYRSTTSGAETLLVSGVGTTSYSDTSLTNGTSYFYKVAAVNAGGTSPLSSEVSATPQVSAPAAPTNLSAIAGNAQVSLSWTASSGATSYNIYRSITSGAETLLVSGVSTTSYTNTGLTNGTTYFYKVAAVNAGGTSPLSSEVSATPQVSAPAAPTNLTATAGNAQVSLTWTASSGATSYNIYRSTTSGAETLLVSGVGTTSYTNTGLTNGTTYFYKVAAVNAGGTSPLSSEVSATPQVSAPAAPSNLSASAGNAQVSLSWTASSGATSYNIYRSTTSGAETLLAAGISTTSYTNTGLTNGTSYFYKVAAVNAGGTSPLSSEVSATPQVSAPAAPTNLSAIAGNAQVSLTWTASSGATSYNVYRSTTSGAETLLVSGVGTTSYSDTSLTNGTTYFYKVAAVNAGGTSPLSSEVSATPQVSAPAAPTNLSAIAGNAQVSLTWTASSGATSYNIYRSTTSGAETLLAAGISTSSYTNTGLTNGTSYFYKVAAVNAGGTSPLSSEVSATPQVSAPAAPTNLSAIAGNAQVSLTWTASSGATSYNIYRSTTSGAETLLVSGISTTSYTNTGLTNGTTYFYKVAAVNAGGTSPLSSEVSATPQVPAPTAPTNLAATAGNAQVSLSWTASSGAASYNIYRSTASGSETLLTSGVSGTSYTDSGLSNGTTYYYQVTAVNAGGQSSRTGEVSATPAAQVFIGEQNSVLSSVDSNNANWLIAQQATLSQTATIQSLSFYASQAAGTILLGIYDASGPGGGPGKLLAAANQITPVAGWNTAAVVTPVTLAPGTYWLAYLPSSNSLDMPIANTGSAAWYQYNYAPLPTTFSTTPTDATVHWSVYATLTLNSVSPPAAPTGLTATPASGQVSLNWSASSGATSYNIYRSTASGAETLLASGVSGTSYTDSGLSNGTTYFYKVAAVNSGGTSPLSSEVSATPQVPAPASPTNLAATAGNAQVSLTWSAASGATSYNIYRATTSGGEGSTPIATGVSSAAYTDTSLTNGTTYFYKVAAVNAGGTSALSTEASATPQAGGTLVTAIAAGGPGAGAFLADTDFSGGSVSGGTTATIDTSHVTNPAPMSVYQHGRYGNMTYTIPNLTPGATYTVRLNFVEYYWSGPGQRVFNVGINGTQVLSNFDIFAAAGGKNIAITKSFTATASSSGTITISFTSLVDNAMINGIEIYTG